MKKLIFVVFLSFLILVSCSQVPDNSMDSDPDVPDSKTEHVSESDKIKDTSNGAAEDSTIIEIPEIPEIPKPEEEELVHPNVDLSKYTIYDASEEIKYTVQNDHERISALVNAYLLDESYYDELFETVYFRYVCDSNFLCRVGRNGLSPYFENSGNDFRIYDEDSGHTYFLGKYGNLNTYEKLTTYMYDHFTRNVVYDLEGFTIRNVDGYIYSAAVGGVETHLFEPEIELFVDEDIIILKITREWPEDIPQEPYVDYYIMKYFDRGLPSGPRWMWVYFQSPGYEVIREYEAYIAKKQQ